MRKVTRVAFRHRGHCSESATFLKTLVLPSVDVRAVSYSTKKHDCNPTFEDGTNSVRGDPPTGRDG